MKPLSKNPTIRSFKKLKNGNMVIQQQFKSHTSTKKKIMNISEFLDRKKRVSPQIAKKLDGKLKSPKNLKIRVTREVNRQSQRAKKSVKKEKQENSMEKVRKPKKRVEIVRSPPIKKKFINWLRKEESSGKWVRQIESPSRQMKTQYTSIPSKIRQVKSPPPESPKSQVCIKHSLKATIRTPSKSPQPKIVKKTRSHLSYHNASVSPQPIRSKVRQIYSNMKKKHMLKSVGDPLLNDSMLSHAVSKPEYDLANFRSCQNHRQINFNRDSVERSTKSKLNKTQGKSNQTSRSLRQGPLPT